MQNHRTNRDLENGPARYKLIGPDHKAVGLFETAIAAAKYAAEVWPFLEQDPDRTGKGWDIAVIS